MTFTRIEPTGVDTTATFGFQNVSVTSNTVTNNLTVNNAFSSKTINVTNGANLGPVANLKITGGSANLSLMTDGNGNVRWDTPTVESANTVRNAAQPNITSVGTLTVFAANNGTLTTNVPYTFTSNWNASGTTFSALEVRVTDTASSPASSLLNLSVGGASKFSVTKTGAINGNSLSVTGNVSAAFVSGTLTTAAQPNITSIGQLSVLGVTSNITAGNLIVSGGIYGPINGPIGGITPNTGTFTNVAINNNLAVSGNLSSGNANLGNTVRGNFFIGDGGLLSNLTVTASSANYANFAGSVVSSSQPNITTVGTLGNLVVSGQLDTARVTTTSSSENFAVVTSPGTTLSRSYLDGTVVLVEGLTSNFGINFTSVPLVNGTSIVFVVVLRQGSIAAYSPTSFSLNGSAQTINWLSGIVPASIPSKTETYSFICMRYNNGWLVTGQMNSYG